MKSKIPNMGGPPTTIKHKIVLLLEDLQPLIVSNCIII